MMTLTIFGDLYHTLTTITAHGKLEAVLVILDTHNYTYGQYPSDTLIYMYLRAISKFMLWSHTAQIHV